MRLVGFGAAALSLLISACAGPVPRYVAIESQYAHSPNTRTARMSVPASPIGAEPLMSVSDRVPVINVEPICQGIANQGDDTSDNPEKAKKDCLDSEYKVRDNLGRVWGSFDASDRNHCVTETRMGGESSYTELLTCLEMAADVRKTHEETNAARHAQSVDLR
jgi:hypothetical protein